MTIVQEFDDRTSLPKYGLHLIPEHILTISRNSYLDSELLDVLVRYISKGLYTEAQNTIKTMHLILGKLPSSISIGDKRSDTILRLNTIKQCLLTTENRNAISL